MKKELKPCETSCKGQIINAKKGIYCQHIESLLGREKARVAQGVNLLPNLDNFCSNENPAVCLSDLKNVIKEFKRCGLENHERKLVWLRVVASLSCKEVIIEQGWVDKNSVDHFYRKALKKLRKGGFRIT